MSRKTNAAAAVLFGILAAVNLYFYITTCAWLIKELLLLICIMLSSLYCGLYLGQCSTQ